MRRWILIRNKEKKKAQENAFFKDLQHVHSINLYLLPKASFFFKDYFGIEPFSKADWTELKNLGQREALEISCPNLVHVWVKKN